MNIQKFINNLKALLENKAGSEFKIDQEAQLSTSSFLTCTYGVEILRLALDCLQDEEVYCELGCYQGDNLVKVLQDCPEVMAYAVDDYADFDVFDKSPEIFIENLEKSNLQDQVFFCQQSNEEFFTALKEVESTDKIGVLNLTNPQNSDNLLRDLLKSQLHLADQAVIIIGNINWQEIANTTQELIQTCSNFRLLLELSSNYYGHLDYGNGLQILIWSTKKCFVFDELSPYHQSHNSNNLSASLDQLFKEALYQDIAGNNKSAERLYRQILALDKQGFQSWHNLGMLCNRRNSPLEALALLAKCISLEPDKSQTWYSIAQVFEQLNDLDRLVQAYERVISYDSQHIDALNNLGNIYTHINKLDQAEKLYRKAIDGKPDHFGSYLNLGNVQLKQDHYDQAIISYNRALELQPRHPATLYGLGSAYASKNDNIQASIYFSFSYYRSGDFQAAIDEFSKIIEVTIPDEHFYVSYADCCCSANQHEKAIDVYHQGIKQYPNSISLYFGLVLCLQAFGKVEEAITVAEQATDHFPENFFFKYRSKLVLPILYRNPQEIEAYRNTFANFSNQMYEEVLSNPIPSEEAISLTSYDTNFYLQYQGKNDLQLQMHYGEVVEHVVSHIYPYWSKSRKMPPLSQEGKLRIGYISPSMHGHTVAKLSIGWLQKHNSNQFEIYAYSLAPRFDHFSQLFKLHSNKFYHLPRELEVICQQVLTDELHILVFLDIGMSPIMTQLAALRLAPVQCTTWGHPITSGLKTIDYFLSSDLMEPDNGAEHYSEKMVRLPNIGFSYVKPEVPILTKTRSDFQLRDNALVYLSCQSLYKYLPQYDWVFPAIAKQVPQAQFAFLSHPSIHITNLFRERLKNAFDHYGLDYQNYCISLSRLNMVEYWNLNLLSDIFLDTFSWSGGNTTLEAIACNLPVVTCPGEFMRGRHSYGILKMIGITETIASGEKEYVEIAVKLGLNPDWRKQIIDKMASRHDQLYDDKTCVSALEDFYKQLVQEKLSETPQLTANC